MFALLYLYLYSLFDYLTMEMIVNDINLHGLPECFSRWTFVILIALFFCNNKVHDSITNTDVLSLYFLCFLVYFRSAGRIFVNEEAHVPAPQWLS